MTQHDHRIMSPRRSRPSAEGVHARNVRRHDVRSPRCRMDVVKGAGVDVLGNLHACIEWCSREFYEVIKVSAEQDVVSAPSLLEATLDLDAELAGAAFEVFAAWFAFFGSGCVEDSDEDTTNKVVGLDLVWMLGIVEAAVFHMEAVGTDLNLKAWHVVGLSRLRKDAIDLMLRLAKVSRETLFIL